MQDIAVRKKLRLGVFKECFFLHADFTRMFQAEFQKAVPGKTRKFRSRFGDQIAGAVTDLCKHGLGKHITGTKDLKNVPLMFVTPAGIAGASTRDVQPQKVFVMFVTPAGIAGASTRDVQPQKVFVMSVTPAGIADASTRDVHLQKVFHILVTLSGITGASVMLEQPSNVP